ncbi:origin recognition complex subunit 2 isoform X2 [Condylostylus longicornis]|nr:origin recognition complex subunit 2 isoform X2 [Condylostylus longicornis]
MRNISPPKRYSENEYEIRSSARKRRTINYCETNNLDDDIEKVENEFVFLELNENKEVELFDEDVDVAGRNIYGFVTPKKKDGLQKIVKNTPKTPKTPKTPRTPKTPGTSKVTDTKRPRRIDLLTKTPCRVRNKMKKEIAKKLQESSDDDDFSADESEYTPSEEEDSGSSEENQNNSSSDEDNAINQEVKHTKTVQGNFNHGSSIFPKTPSSRRSNRLLAKEYVPKAEEYFTAHASKKITTSNHTLDRLKNPKLPADQLFSILKSIETSAPHEKAISNLLKEYQNNFTKWLIMLSEGFNIICYGLGSKRKLLNCFHKQMLAEEDVVVINGFFPSLTLKDILDGIVTDILDISNSPTNPHEAVDLIEEQYSHLTKKSLFLIVHNIDGPMLRNCKAQEILSRLAKISNIHLIASIDHINAPLLWDSAKLSNYNFLWWDTTTMLPYTDETAFENSLMIQNSDELALSSMRSVFLSLTTNSRGIYMLIVKHQLKHGKTANYQGMSFKDLYHACRDAFLVSSDLALRAQLTEFLDHKLVRSKRNVDGTEFLLIPINAELLQQLVSEQETID